MLIEPVPAVSYFLGGNPYPLSLFIPHTRRPHLVFTVYFCSAVAPPLVSRVAFPTKGQMPPAKAFSTIEELFPVVNGALRARNEEVLLQSVT